MKTNQAVADMGITWYTFLADLNEGPRVADGVRLLSVEDDETAGFLRLVVDGSIREWGQFGGSSENGRVTDDLRSILRNALPTAR
jgi:hypothetical protein